MIFFETLDNSLEIINNYIIDDGLELKNMLWMNLKKNMKEVSEFNFKRSSSWL